MRRPHCGSHNSTGLYLSDSFKAGILVGRIHFHNRAVVPYMLVVHVVARSAQDRRLSSRLRLGRVQRTGFLPTKGAAGYGPGCDS